MKTRVALMFGGKSVEHEVSVISGIQAYLAMDTDKYDVIPVYMTKKNEMYIGDDIGKSLYGIFRNRKPAFCIFHVLFHVLGNLVNAGTKS